MLQKIIIFLLIIAILSPPLIGLTNFLIVAFVIFLYVSIHKIRKINDIFNLKKKFILLIIILVVSKIFIPKLEIQEAHSIFLNKNDINLISKFLPQSIILKILEDYKKFDREKYLKADGDNNINAFLNKKFIDEEYAYSSDSFFQNYKYTRITDTINFTSREDLRMDHLNSIEFNLAYDKHFRRELPFYVLYEIPYIDKQSKICKNGNVYFHFAKNEITKQNIKDINFQQFETKCIFFESNSKYLYILGYSINKNFPIEIKLNKSSKLLFYDFLEVIFNIIIIILLIFTFFHIKFTSNSIIYLISIFSTILICLLKDPNLITGLRYFRGGADGLFHYSTGKNILNNLQNYNFVMALRGGSDIFYFMPGHRYFIGFSNLLFGSNSYSYILLASTLPLCIYIFFTKYISKNLALILFISFIFLPIFENLGFGYFNYLHQVYRNHGETLSILLIIISLIYIINLDKNFSSKHIILTTFFVGFFLSMSAFIRPNFVLTTSVIFLYISYILFKRNYYLHIIVFALSYSTVFFCLIHNLYFGEKFVLFTNSFVTQNFPINLSTYLKAFMSIISFNFNDIEVLNVLNHLTRWNPLYNIHRLVIIIFIIFCFIRYNQSNLNYIIFTCMILQHCLLLFSNPDSRYAYLAWLLTFILFIKLLDQNKILFKITKNFKYYVKLNKK